MLSAHDYQNTKSQLEQLIKKPPIYFNTAQCSNLRRVLRKKLKEHDYATKFPPFQPLPYILYFINRTTPEHTLHQLVDASKTSTEFTLDTESITIYQQRNQPVLIQVLICLTNNSSFALVVEMCHLPRENNIYFNLIQELFRIIFSPDKKLYIFGSKDELFPFTQFHLFSRAQIDSLNPIDLQAKFKIFWNKKHPHQSRTSSLLNSSVDTCICETCLGKQSSEFRSLQDAVAYLLNQYLSKQFTNQNFHIGLDSTLCHMNSNEIHHRQQLTTYALHDILSMQTLLIHMKNEHFDFDHHLKNYVQYDFLELSPISSLDDEHDKSPVISAESHVTFSTSRFSGLQSSNSTVNLPEQLIPPPTRAQSTTTTTHDWEPISSNDDSPQMNPEIIPSPSIVQSSTFLPDIRPELTAEEKKRIHNRSCTLRQRRRYYQHTIIRRDIDRRFTVTQIKTILHQLKIRFTAINISTSSMTNKTSLYIGIRQPSKFRTYEQQTRHLFNTEHFEQLPHRRRRTIRSHHAQSY